MKQKKITVVCSAYNAKDYIKPFFENILKSDNLYEIKCILVINSPDTVELEICSQYTNLYPDLFEVIHVPHRETIGASLNRGFKKAQTEYLCYVDIDDYRLHDSFRLQKETLDAHPSADFTYGDYVLVRHYGEIDGKYITTPEFSKFKFSRGSYTGPTHFFRRKILHQYGYWDEQLRSGGDFDFQARNAMFGTLFVKTNGLMLYKTNPTNSTSAGNGYLQALEKDVISRRYAIYDKVNLMYFIDTKKYNLHEIKNFDDYIPIASLSSIYNFDRMIKKPYYIISLFRSLYYIVRGLLRRYYLKRFNPERYNYLYQILKIK